ARVRFDQDVKDLTDGALLGDGFSQRQVSLDLVPIETAVLLLHHIAAFGKIGDDAVSAALGDTQRGSDVAQARAGVPGDPPYPVRSAVRLERSAATRSSRCRDACRLVAVESIISTVHPIRRS